SPAYIRFTAWILNPSKYSLHFIFASPPDFILFQEVFWFESGNLLRLHLLRLQKCYKSKKKGNTIICIT
ncbi:MAG: hypothetical protein PUA56_02930, partial [Bacillales bacterium]|nr:hypothetical protein [Bacillales bacterium]